MWCCFGGGFKISGCGLLLVVESDGYLAVIFSMGWDFAGFGFGISIWCYNGGFGGLVWCFNGVLELVVLLLPG